MSFKVNRLVSAAYVAFGMAVIGATYAPNVYAQSNATGSIFGAVQSPGDATIAIENLDTGVKRSITPDSNGKYQALSLPTGRYKVSLVRSGAVVSTRENVEVRISQGSEVAFSSQSLETVKITGQKQTIDVSNSGSTSVFTADQLERIPVAPSVSAVIQLAPGTTRGDSRYGGVNAPSFGGAGATENAYYINGFAVTAPLLQIGAPQLPFNSISQAQILTGGYSAEFGRSTGGVVNIVTKSGSNEWKMGVGTAWEPDALRAKEKDIVYPKTGVINPSTLVPDDGRIFFRNEDNKTSSYSYNGYISGPIIKDKLFFYVAGEFNRTEADGIRRNVTTASGVTGISAGGWQERNIKNPRYLGKLDWNITDNHHLEFTAIGDKYEDDRKYFDYNYRTISASPVQNGGADYINWGPTPAAAQQGASTNILKYTGYITEDVTLTALVGKSKTPHKFDPVNYNPTLFQVTAPDTERAPGLNYIFPQTTTGNVLTQGAEDEQKGYRFDVEYKLNQQHTVRAGIDRIKIKSIAGNTLAGGGRWDFLRQANPNDPIDAPLGGVPNNGTPLGSQGYFVQQIFISAVSSPSVEQEAQYIEDKFQVTDRLLVSLGLRNEQFTNYNGDGLPYIKQRHQLAPRLGAVWDAKGDSTLKVFGNAGRYHLQLPTNVAVRAAGSSLFTQRNFTYTGIDPVTGAPTGLQPISDAYSINNEFGQAKDPVTVAGQNLKANYQDEFSLGFEQALSATMNVGVKATYRKLGSTIDDFCDSRPFVAWAQRNIPGYDPKSYPGFNCALFNPGEGSTFYQDVNGDGVLEKIDLSKEELGYPEVKRSYLALDFFVEYPFDGKFYGKLNYTWSRSRGNTEGQVLSDVGQADVATTRVFDEPELSDNASGLLPNDRTHQIKAFGYYQATSEWGVGANFLLASGRPKNCIGNFPDSTNPAAGYNSAFFYCDDVASPRGSRGRLPWDQRLDMNVIYKPEWFKGLAMKVDLFNVFNKQTIQNIDETYNVAGSTNRSNTYGRVISYSEPRYMRLAVNYDIKF